MPNLSNLGPVENPLNPRSIMNVVIPFDPFSGSVFAYTMSVDAIGPLVILYYLVILVSPSGFK